MVRVIWFIIPFIVVVLVRLFNTPVSSPHLKRKSCGIVEFLEYVTQSHCNELFFFLYFYIFDYYNIAYCKQNFNYNL